MKGFITRSQAGLMRPKSFSRNIQPQNGGSAIHWGGLRQHVGTHNRCDECYEIWRNWQRFHMVNRGWADIAYTMGFCNHGFVFAGRGFNTRTAAQGSTDGNNRFYAFVWIGGVKDPMTADAVKAMQWCVNEAREKGNAGMQVRPHSNFNATTCPGPRLAAEAAIIHNKAISLVPTPVDPPPPPVELEPEDWFTMATEEDLKRIVREEIEDALDNRSYGADMSRVRRSLRAVAAEAGLETEHAVPDGYKVEA